MNKRTIIILGGLSIGAASVSATLLVDVDNTMMQLAGTQVTINATDSGNAGFINTGGRYDSITPDSPSVGDITAVNGTSDPTKKDFYLQFTSLNLAELDATSFKYAEFSYTLGADFVASEHKFRVGDTVSVTGPAGANDAFSNPELLDTAAATMAGAHSFIVDLQADVTYAGDWQYLRWNYYNDTANQGKSITLEKVTFATGIAAIPEPSAAAAILGLAAFGGLMIRRRR